jgi:uncharacterized protein YjgD (DUF1641 family)
MRVNVIILVAFLLSGLVLSSQQRLNAAPINDWQKLIQEGSTHKFDGQYNVAIQLFTKALNLAESQKLPTKCLPISLCRLAAVEVITHKITEADSHFLKIVDLIKQQKEAGTLDPQVSFWAAVLSDEYINNKSPETREICLKRACYLKALIYSDTHKECTDCLNKLAECYIQNNKVEKAIHLLTITNAIMDKKYGKDPDRLGDTLHKLALKCEAAHQYEQAKQLELAVIKIAKTNSQYLSAGLPAFYYFLSMNAYIQRKTAESKEYFQLALSACPRIKNSRKKSFILHAVLYFTLPNYEEISLAMKEFELKQGLTLTKALSTDLPWQYYNYNLLGGVLAAEGKAEESEACLARTIAIAKVPNCYAAKDLPQLYLDMGICKARKSEMDKAAKAFVNALKEERDKNGFHSALVLFWWAYFLREHHQYQLASEKLNTSLKWTNALSPEKRGTLLADILQMLAVIRYEHNRPDLAYPLTQLSSTEIQRQKKLKSNLGPDFYHRM